MLQNEHLLVGSDQDRDTYALFEYDPENDVLIRTIYEHPTAQITHVAFDYSGTQLLGVGYIESGAIRYHYFDSKNDRYQRSLEHKFPGESVVITSRSQDERFITAFVTSAKNPGVYYLLDGNTWKARILGRVLPWLEPEKLAPAKAFRVDSSDGTEVEGFLTVPSRNSGLPPLVVMPHGGPIGVRDDRGFDPTAQFLTSNGFAVLKVNYRGSSGYGNAFRDAGKKEWGGKIEDDIDAVVEHVISMGWADGTNMCIVGSSYGGYSALMSIVRHPDWYQCAATLSGVTDIALMFSSSDFEQSEFGRSEMAEIVGDPNEEYDRMKAASPVYRVDEMETPIHLAHGTHDRRVNVEHAHRLRAMLELKGKRYVWYPLDGAPHGFLNQEQGARYHEELRRFLYFHLR